MKQPILLYRHEVVNEHPHDKSAWTQGIILEKGSLYESTGTFGSCKSSLRRVDLKSGEIIKHHFLGEQYFGEGITIFKDQILQLTWRNRLGFVYDLELNQRGKFQYRTEGWGIAACGNKILMSNGSAKLYSFNPDGLSVNGSITVKMGEKPVRWLNELQFVKGLVFANVWYSDKIVMISPDSGQVTGIIDLEGIISKKSRGGRDNVANGIAYDEASSRLFVTGKCWPKIFEIALQPKD